MTAVARLSAVARHIRRHGNGPLWHTRAVRARDGGSLDTYRQPGVRQPAGPPLGEAALLGSQSRDVAPWNQATPSSRSWLAPASPRSPAISRPTATRS